MHLTSLADSRRLPLPLPLDDRPVCGRDLLFLQQWFHATLTETCYLLGLSLPKWRHGLQHPDEPVNDPTVALLVWVLATYPETHFLPTFPQPAEVYPLFKMMAGQSTKTLGFTRKTRLGKTAFGLLLGREITSSNRWLSEKQPRPPDPQVYRLLFVLRNLLLTYGVVGFDAWVDRVELEAEARNLRFSSQMTSWSRMKAPPESSARAQTPARTAGPRRPPPPEERYALTPVRHDPNPFGLNTRPVRGSDLTFLRQWTRTSIADCCYLLGITAVQWHDYDRCPDPILSDASVSLLAWALLNYPEAHFLPVFPDPVTVYPAYENVVRHSSAALPEPETAFSLLLGQARTATKRWLAGFGGARHALPPPVRRLLLVLQTLLTTRGVPGFEALVNRACFEATVRGLDLLSPSMVTWTQRAPYRPRTPSTRRLGRPPKHKDVSEPTTAPQS